MDKIHPALSGIKETVIGVTRSSESSCLTGEFTHMSKVKEDLMILPGVIQNCISMLAKRPISVNAKCGSVQW